MDEAGVRTRDETTTAAGGGGGAGRALYEADEHAWVARQVDALRSGRLGDLDRGTLAEHLVEMTVSDRRELRSRLAVLLAHVLKCRHQPERLSKSWRDTISDQQEEIAQLLADIPSLRRQVPDLLPEAYRRAVSMASRETGLPRSAFPAAPPMSAEEALAYEPPGG